MKLYRYRHFFGQLQLLDFEITAQTMCGAWIELHDGKDRWVRLSGKKRYAYPNKGEALINFIERTKRYIMFTKQNLECAQTALDEAEKRRTADDQCQRSPDL